MFIDTHCHVDEKEIQPDVYFQHAKETNVNNCILSFCDPKDLYIISSFLEKYPQFYLTVGFHPEYANEIDEEAYVILEELVSKEPKIVAIGEIGLDYYWVKDNKEIQRQVLYRQLELAKKLHLPVVIHSRDSIGEIYEILKEYPEVKGVIHCFSGSLEMANKFIELGYYLGIGGVLTFKNSKLWEVIEKVPLSSILLETDSPYLAPEPVRGTVNESKNIPYIANRIAEIKNVSVEEVANVTTHNAIQLFDLPV